VATWFSATRKLIANFDREFANGSLRYAGSGTLCFTW
jgi:hypothetical protein